MSDAPSSKPAETPQQLVAGRFTITEQIGRGGRATVYSAHDSLLNREVAVKVFSSTARDAADLKLQEAEARLIAGMNHHALTTLFDAGIDTTDPTAPQIYLVMERIPGLDLRRHIHTYGPLTPGQVGYLGFDLAEGLQFVHEHGFLHRDIKPANILLATRRASTRLRGKLADFGISTIIGIPEHGETTTGTAAYLSPELVEGLEPTTASDVYSLGLVLLEALTGTVAYPGHVEESAFARLDHDPYIPDTVPAALADLLRRMTALEPADRPDLTEISLGFLRVTVQDLVDTGLVSPTLLPTNEDERLAAVHRYNILDTPADEAFDRITDLACRMLHVPVALVSIVDGDREWFKARRGIDLTEIHRDVALCATAIATGEPVTVADVQAGDAFADNPIVHSRPDLHGYAAVPITTNDGHAIGTLCIFTDEVRTFTTNELDDLAQLAGIAVRELEFRASSRRALFT